MKNNLNEKQQDIQQLNSELEEFKKQQQVLMTQYGLKPDQVQQPDPVPNTIEQASPSAFKLDSNEFGLDNIEEKLQQINKTSDNSINNPVDTIVGVKANKASLALLTLEEEILSESVEIYLPGLKKNVTIMPLKNIEELNIKTQNLTFSTFLRQLNITLFNKTTIKNIPLKEFISNIEEFENTILPIDRMLLIFGLIKNSFQKLAEYNMVCESCGNEFIASPNVENLDLSYNIPIKKLTEVDLYNLTETKVFLNKKLEIDFGFNPEAIRMKLVDYKNNSNLKENLNENQNILDNLDNLILFIKEIRVYKLDKRTKEGRKLVTTINFNEDGFDEVFDFIHGLPMKIRDILTTESKLDTLEKYSPEFFINETCPHCGHIHKLPIAPEIEFFRKTLSLLA